MGTGEKHKRGIPQPAAHTHHPGTIARRRGMQERETEPMADHGWLLDRPIAHRGLHAAGIPENSLAACREAIRNGYPVELDVRMTRDDVPVVFHDANLLRMTGLDRVLETCSIAGLRKVSLAGTGERIPSLAEFLATAGGRTGLLIEVKPHGDPGRAESILAAMLDSYPGPFAIASFDPRILRWFRKHRPGWIRVQVSGRLEHHAVSGIPRFLMKNHLVLPVSRPDVLACEITHLGPWTRFIAGLFRIPLIAWTVRDPATADAIRESVATIIFEGFRCRKS